MNPRILPLISILLFWGTKGLAVEIPIPGSTPENFVGGAGNLQLVTKATSITTFRIVSPGKSLKQNKPVTIAKRACDPTPSILNGPEVAHVISALTDMNNFGGALICDFDPGIILRFSEPRHTLDLLICFHCHEMALYSDGLLVHRPYQWARTMNTFHGEARQAFVAIAKKAFPNDPEIKELKP